jgi:hypothetical protein
VREHLKLRAAMFEQNDTAAVEMPLGEVVQRRKCNEESIGRVGSDTVWYAG